jgi:hypothetical protein
MAWVFQILPSCGGLHWGTHRFQPSAQRPIGKHLATGRLQALLPPVPRHRLEVQHPLAITQPALSRTDRDLGLLPADVHCRPASTHFWRPASLAGHVVGPALAAADQVLALGNQPLVQLTGEQRDALGSGVVPKSVARHADLAAAAGAEHLLIEIGPGLAVTLRRCHP